MKKLLTKILICPTCLPYENELFCEIIKEQNQDIITGSLKCNQCKGIYQIKNGIAFLEPINEQIQEETINRYETSLLVSSYLWSHYSDILKDSLASTAYLKWADLMDNHSGISVDTGCAVGRYTFEMSKKSDFAIGIDNSKAFIESARNLALKRKVKFNLKTEGLLTKEVKINLPETWNTDKVEFIVGDAQKIPFKAKTLTSFASINLVDKLPFPIQHLKEMNRVIKDKKSQVLFSDPFSWSTDVTKQENWLGGTEKGEYKGRGADNITGLLKQKKGVLAPVWEIKKQGFIPWKIRTHSNHFESIQSCFIKATR
ncbi:MAG: SAM-dependent methyltransferase [Desulfobacteraceae bacterium 4572_130]|nr:MAG: SAM-dependent methyltransferase [Desulfobacteraceae bacterium 4572_130]